MEEMDWNDTSNLRVREAEQDERFDEENDCDTQESLDEEEWF